MSESTKRNPGKLNNGVLAFHPPKGFEPERTVVITGPSRSGTTMLAQIISRMGVPLGGDEMDINLMEDDAFRSMVQNGDLAGIGRLVEKRNARFPVWGWKYPGSQEYLDEWERTLRNPYFVFTFRDPISISVRNLIQEGEQLETLSNMRDALGYMEMAVSFIERSKRPCLCVSYEKTLARPSKVIRQLAGFLGFPLSDKKLQELLMLVQADNPRYASQHLWESHIGHLEGVEGGVVSGWAWIRGEPGSVRLEILVDEIAVGVVDAAIFRQDLKNAGVGNGCHAFSFALDQCRVSPGNHRVDVCFASNGFPLQGCPMQVVIPPGEG